MNTSPEPLMARPSFDGHARGLIAAGGRHGVDTARTLLFVPGNRPERSRKAADSGADLVVLDLENADATLARRLGYTELGPSDDELRWARRFLATAAERESVVSVDGQMVDKQVSRAQPTGSDVRRSAPQVVARALER